MSRLTNILISLDELSQRLQSIPIFMYIFIAVLAGIAFIIYKTIPKLELGFEKKIRSRKMVSLFLIIVYMLFLLMLKMFAFVDIENTENMVIFGIIYFIEYFFLGTLFSWYQKKKPEILQPLVTALVFATAAETLRFLVQKDIFNYFYVIAAVLGVLVSCLFTKAWKYTSVKKKKSANIIAVRIILIVIYLLIVAMVVLFGVYHILRISGAASMRKNLSSVEQDMLGDDTDGGNYIRHNGKLYRYNDQLTVILFMGIDQRSDEIEAVEHVSNDSTQADSIFLFVMNDQDKSGRLIGISRDTMTEIKTYDYNGEYVGESVNHLALGYTFGDGKEKSCLNMVDAVSKLFHGMPIHSYIAINMNAIKDINDTIGGVPVTVIEDLTAVDSKLRKGNEVILKGETALQYVRWRDSDVDFSNDQRMERQKQYLMNFMQQAVKAVKTDFSLPSRLYANLTKEMVTNISLDEAVYLSSKILSIDFSEESITQLKGESVKGAFYDEFYADEDALIDLILDAFYIEESAGEITE